MRSQVEVYARLKPCFSRYGSVHYAIDPIPKNRRSLKVLVPKLLKYGQVANNLRDFIDFSFKDAFDINAPQEEVFEKVSKEVVSTCLDGYNGTIFAYGQTGSGKTYTMSGADSWKLRGIIPRVLTYIFDELEKRKANVEYNLYISYMEIYNENAYDLLDRQHLEIPLEQWNKITMFEDDDGHIHLRNLSVHHCQTEQQGIDLLMMGNFIRKVSSSWKI